MSYYDFNNAKGLRSSFSSASSGPTSITFPITMCAWIYTNANHWADTGTDVIMSMSDAYNNSDASNLISLNKAGGADTLRLRATSGAAASTSAPTNSHADTTYDKVWLPIVAVFAADNDRKLYVNSSSDVTTDTTQQTPDANFTELTVGYYVYNTFNAFIPFTDGGRIAECAIFTSDWSADTTKVDDFMGGLRADKCDLTNCYAYWPMQTDQATHTDSGPNGGPDLIEVSTILFDSVENPTISQGSTINTVTINTGQRITVTDGSPIQ